MAETREFVESALKGGNRCFDGLDLSGAVLDGLNLTGASFVGARLDKTSFKRADLRGASFVEAAALEAVFDKSDLRGASFARAYLSFASFTCADLVKCDFTGAELAHTVLAPWAALPATDLSAFKGSHVLIGYRTHKSLYAANTVYNVGVYDAPVFSTCTQSYAHPGIYVSPTPDHPKLLHAAFKRGVVEVEVSPNDLLGVEGYYRARRIVVKRVLVPHAG